MRVIAHTQAKNIFAQMTKIYTDFGDYLQWISLFGAKEQYNLVQDGTRRILRRERRWKCFPRRWNRRVPVIETGYTPSLQSQNYLCKSVLSVSSVFKHFREVENFASLPYARGRAYLLIWDGVHPVSTFPKLSVQICFICVICVLIFSRSWKLRFLAVCAWMRIPPKNNLCKSVLSVLSVC